MDLTLVLYILNRKFKFKFNLNFEKWKFLSNMSRRGSFPLKFLQTKKITGAIGQTLFSRGLCWVRGIRGQDWGMRVPWQGGDTRVLSICSEALGAMDGGGRGTLRYSGSTHARPLQENKQWRCVSFSKVFWNYMCILFDSSTGILDRRVTQLC